MIKSLSVFLMLATIASASTGTAGFDLLRRDVSAPSVALASATVAFAQTTSWGGNPALLAQKIAPLSSVAYVDYPLDLKTGFLGYSRPYRGFVFGGRLVYCDYGTFDRVSASGQKLGTFGANDIYVAGMAAKKLGEWSLGGEAGFLNSKIDSYSASALSFSAGIAYSPAAIPLTHFGADIQNGGINIKKYSGSSTDFPTQFRVGAAKRLEHLPLTLVAMGHKWRDTDWYFAGGGEFEIAESFRLRAGYNTYGSDQKVSGTGDSVSGLNAGFGLSYRSYLFDFAYSFQGTLGNRLSVQFNWLPPAPGAI